ncbi:MAG: hypothetical protein IPM71_06910 [Bacteroidota bacterium]|nr:MAG: hypothetical protein IPM71_06910 [Bacteroidota bacterium]
MNLKPEQLLINGAEILSTYLSSLDFKFKLIETGHGSGGDFAHGQFINEDKTIDLHFRWSLGLVSYKINDLILSHEDYIDLVDKHGQNKYPNFSDDPLDAFRCLLIDLKDLLNDFTENNAIIFRQKASDKIIDLNKIRDSKNNSDKKIYSGDQRIIDQIRIEFKAGNFLQVDKLKYQIQYPDLLTATEKKLLEINDDKIKNNR